MRSVKCKVGGCQDMTSYVCGKPRYFGEFPNWKICSEEDVEDFEVMLGFSLLVESTGPTGRSLGLFL